MPDLRQIVAAATPNINGGIVAPFKGADTAFSRPGFTISHTGDLAARLDTRFDAVALYAATGNVPNP